MGLPDGSDCSYWMDPRLRGEVRSGGGLGGSQQPHVSLGFTKRLREPIMRGEITCTVRIWQRAHVKVGGRYAFEPGVVEVTSIREITLDQVTPDLARRSGFLGVVDLLKIAKHGPGERVYLIEFEYIAEG